MKIDLDNLTAEESKIFNDVAHDICTEFNTMIGQVSDKYRRNIHWLVGSIPSRNPLLSPLFERCCKIALLKKLQGTGATLSEIRVADKALAKTLIHCLDFQNSTITCQSSFLHSFKSTFFIIKKYAVILYTVLCRYLARSTHGRQTVSSDAPINIVDVYILKGESGPGKISDNCYNDRYYPGLLSTLSRKELAKTFYLASFYGFYNYFKAFRLARSAREKFIIPDDFPTLQDYFIILIHPLKLLLLPIPQTIFKDIDITSLLRQEKRQTCCNSASTLALLNYRFSMRLAQHGKKVRILLKWYENQVNDRGMIIGFRRFFPNARITGYQGFMVPEIPNIHSSPTSFEMECQVTPHIVAVIGRKMVTVPRKFCPDIQVTLAPALRFQELWIRREGSPDPDFFTIIVGLPIYTSEACAILKMISTLIDHPSIAGNCRFRLKPHPAHTPESLLQECGIQFPATNVEFISGNINEHLLQADILISSGSSVCIESLARGIPVLVIGNPNGFTQNPIMPGINKDLWRLCYTNDEIIDALDFFHKLKTENPDFFIREGQRIRAGYFEPTNRTNTKALLDLPEITER